MNPSLLTAADPFWASWMVRIACAVTLVWMAAAACALSAGLASAAVRHRIWALSVVAALAIPFLTMALPEFRTGWVKLGSPVTVNSDRPSATDAAFAVSRAARGPEHPVVAPYTAMSNDASPSQPAKFASTAGGNDASGAPTVLAPTAIAPAQWTPLAILILWAIPAATALAVTARSMRAARRLVRQASLIEDDDCREALRKVMSASQRRIAIELRESSLTLSPLCVGWRRPAIVLPHGW